MASAVGFCFTVATCVVAFSGNSANPAVLAATPAATSETVPAVVAGKVQEHYAAVTTDAPASPSDLVPQLPLLDSMAKAGTAGPVSPTDPELRPFDEALPEFGALQGFFRSWLANGEPGGYTVYAWEFPSADFALAARDESFDAFTLEFGAAPVELGEDVRAAVVMGDTARAWWVEGNFLRVVDLSTQPAGSGGVAKTGNNLRTIVTGMLG